MAKYKNYKQLSEAFKSGALDRKHYSIVLDKGGADASLCFMGGEGLTDQEIDKKNEAAQKLFDPPYSDHIEDLYAALEIPVQWC